MSAVFQVAVMLGTRPEGIKCAPLIMALRDAEDIQVSVISTGQHKEMLAQALHPFGITPDVDFGLMRPQSDLPWLISNAIQATASYIREYKPDMLLVQGDTSTALAVSLGAFCEGTAVGHVEAGLRSHDRCNPFPEEVNRRTIALLAELHFAPTEAARDALIGEGVPEHKVLLTGNTVVDSLHYLTRHAMRPVKDIVGRSVQGKRLILVTAHRRESWGAPLKEICHAVLRLAQRYPDVLVVFPVHKNPVVRDVVHAHLRDMDSVCLLDPLEYFDFLSLLQGATLALTDSGGIQEEAPTFRVPVLVMRDVTERMEAVQAGLAQLVGTCSNTIVREASRLLDNADVYARMRTGHNPFGDGQASRRIVEAMRNWQQGCSRLLAPTQLFVPSAWGPC